VEELAPIHNVAESIDANGTGILNSKAAALQTEVAPEKIWPTLKRNSPDSI
jgi:hypothetical protein